MKTFFTNGKQSSVDVAEPKQTQEQIIQEIHNSFYSESGKLLYQAENPTPLVSNQALLLEKSERLKKLGFGNTKDVAAAQNEEERLSVIRQENFEAESLRKAIMYFKQKYPQYKFIPESSVIKICEKYNLIYGEVSRYKGFVPEKNLKAIEAFKIKPEDECYAVYENSAWLGSERVVRYQPKTIQHNRSYRDNNGLSSESRWLLSARMTSYESAPLACPLEIAAPQSDFNTEGMEIKNKRLRKIEVPDPIVLKPVFFEGSKHYLIVTAWGLEASDELVVNEQMN